MTEGPLPPPTSAKEVRENSLEGQSIGGESALLKSSLKTKEGAYLASFTGEAEAGGSLEPRSLEQAKQTSKTLYGDNHDDKCQQKYRNQRKMGS